MGRRKHKRRRMAEAAEGVQRSTPHNEVQDPALRLVAVHPTQPLLALAVGSQLKLANLSSKTLVPLQGAMHSAPIRVCTFDHSGKLLLTGGDDKTARLWETATGACVSTMQAPKKVSAGTFSGDSLHVVLADKFGDVLVAKVGEESPTSSLLLSHFASFIMSLNVTPDQKYVISCDRDSKIRVSDFPSDPAKGSYRVQAYCQGHKTFVTDSAVIEVKGQMLLLSAGGDGTVRLWRPLEGELLHTLQVGHVRSQPPQEADEKEQEAGEQEAGEQEAGENGHKAEDGKRREAEQEQAQAKTDEHAEQEAGLKVQEPGQEAEQQQQQQQQQEAGKKQGSGSAVSASAPAAEEGKQQEGEGEDRQGDGEGEGEADDDEDEEGDDEDDGLAELTVVSSLGVPPRDLTDYAPVLSLAVASDRCSVAATLEGEQQVVMLTLCPDTLTLRESARISFPGVSYPVSVSFDGEDRLWVVGGVPLQTSTAVHLGVAQRQGDEWVPCTEAVLGSDLQQALEERSAAEEAAVKEGVEFEWYSQHLKKKSFTAEELGFRKRKRNDFKESARLALLHKTQKKQQ